ncbi:MAG: rRNA maturation RNase YbeY [Bacteroidales bacterium]
MKSEINFFKENVSFVFRKKDVLRNWILNAIEREGKNCGDLNFIFCDDEYLAELNYKYLNHKTLTDILTFSFDDEHGSLCGDIFISWPRVLENAGTFNQKPADELHRVIIHGVLHLIGYDDTNKKLKTIMTEKENFYLALLNSKGSL